MPNPPSDGAQAPAPDITLRPASDDDAAAIAHCVEAAYRPYIPRIGKPPGPMLDDYAEVVRRHRVFIAEMGSALAGVLVLVRTPRGMLLDNIAVHPEHQRRGIGRRLLHLAESEAHSLGCSHLELYTHELMTENIALYGRAGYAETARRRERGYDRVYMRKTLRRADDPAGKWTGE